MVLLGSRKYSLITADLLCIMQQASADRCPSRRVCDPLTHWPQLLRPRLALVLGITVYHESGRVIHRHFKTQYIMLVVEFHAVPVVPMPHTALNAGYVFAAS